MSETAASDDAIVRLRAVHKTYLLGLQGVAALRGVSLDIRRGEFLVILGRSGSGKTSLLNIIGAVDRPSRGEVHLCGTKVTEDTPDAVLSQLRLEKLSTIYQTFNLLPQLTAVENVELPLVLRGAGDAAWRRRRAMKLLGLVGMTERAGHFPSMLSGGEAQRTAIARSLANLDPASGLLVADECTGDLDSVNTALVLHLLLGLNARGLTCVLVTHDTNVAAYATRVVRMVDGKISHIETVPAFLRADAIERLNNHDAVRAMAAMKAAKKEQERRQRGGRLPTGGLSRASAADDSDEEDDLSPGVVTSPLPDTGTIARASFPAAPVSLELVVIGPKEATTAQPSSTSTLSVPSTSTGLTGVAAISHSIFGGASAVTAATSSGSSQHAPISTQVRNRSSYAIQRAADEFKKRKAAEELERQAAMVAREEALRAMIAARAAHDGR